ncbi:mitochondrial carrier domain-containing protein [Tuber borchii]|uniref:Mitochondrial carrier domain-containing protein n=1 Tax=Tuber borchii TaxID=42251 RepID=A0A2T6ZRB5_TUBBO|nr:mitochondrial carrier domain-containing protein [Tuber borchii]
MSGLVTPTYATLSAVFPSTPFSVAVPQKTPRLQPSVASLYPYASISEEAKKLGKEAQEEFRHASEATQKKAGKIDMYSPKFYAACTLGGVLACGLTHTAVTPLDLVKCRRQVDSKLYRSNIQAWRTISSAEGIRGIFTGWSPTFFGYCVQGGIKYGGYEFFKKFYSDLAGPEKAARYKTAIYLAGSASAEFIADIMLCPFESVKVRMQTTIPPEFKGTTEGLKSVVAKEGLNGLYKGLYPLWGRQIPYTMMKFASFETTVEMIYNYLPKSKDQYGTGVQTTVSFAGGYIAGILCAIVSHPADVMVSKLNANRLPGEAFGASMKRIYGEIGFVGLWNGLPVRIVMIGTLTGLQWLLYDSFKLFVGLPTTGGLAPEKEKK